MQFNYLGCVINIEPASGERPESIEDLTKSIMKYLPKGSQWINSSHGFYAIRTVIEGYKILFQFRNIQRENKFLVIEINKGIALFRRVDDFMDYNYEKLIADLKQTLKNVKSLYKATREATDDIAAILSPLSLKAEHDAATITYKGLTRLVDSFTFRIDHNEDLSTQEQIIAEFLKFVISNSKSFSYDSLTVSNRPLASSIESSLKFGEDIAECKLSTIGSMFLDYINEHYQNSECETPRINEVFKALVTEFGKDKIHWQKDKRIITIGCLPVTINMKFSDKGINFYKNSDFFLTPAHCQVLSPDKTCQLIKELQDLYPQYEKKWSEAYELAAKNQKLKKTNQIAFMEFINKKLKVKKKDIKKHFHDNLIFTANTKHNTLNITVPLDSNLSYLTGIEAFLEQLKLVELELGGRVKIFSNTF